MGNKLTNENVHTFKCPEGKKKIEIPDSLVTGLYLEIRMSGKSTYYLRYTPPSTGKLSHIKIASGQDITLAMARKKAKELRAEIALGGDPVKKKKALQEIPLFVDFMKQVYMPWTMIHTKKSSYARKESHLKLHMDDIKNMRLDQIKRSDIQRMQTKLCEKSLSPTSVNRVIQTVRSVLNFACRHDHISTNPVRGISMFPERQIDNWLTKEQASRLLTELPEHLSNMSEFALYTGLRTSNITGLTWNQIDLNRKVLIISADQSKSKKPITVPLIPEAIRVLERVMGKHETYVFTYKGKAITRFTNTAWYAACKRAGITARAHDLRHTWASWHVQAGTPIHDLQALGAWSDVRMAQRYGHLSAERVQQSAHNISEIGIEDSVKEAS